MKRQNISHIEVGTDEDQSVGGLGLGTIGRETGTQGLPDQYDVLGGGQLLGFRIKKPSVPQKGFLIGDATGAFAVAAVIGHQHIVSPGHIVLGGVAPTHEVSSVAVKKKDQTFGVWGLKIQGVNLDAGIDVPQAFLGRGAKGENGAGGETFRREDQFFLEEKKGQQKRQRQKSPSPAGGVETIVSL
jgi:hypothetical protein